MAAHNHASPPGRKALRHVALLSTGGPLPPDVRVTMHFHPDRTAGDRPILDSMAADGVYRSQFVTGTGNGGLTAHPGGDRWRWESRIFAGAYDHAPARERPVYGALNHRHDPVGAAPRFGSSYFRLTAEALARTTFCYPDSSTEPVDFGVAAHCSLIELARSGGLDALDGHIEAQIHGPVALDADVEALVLDPSYRGTAVEAAAHRLPCPVEWHPGFRLGVDELRRRPGYRGQRYVDLGAEIAVGGSLTPEVVGDAARSGRYALQDLKKVWHCLARFGHPSYRAGAGVPECGRPPAGGVCPKER
ncbi:hypothetical protein GCM10010387_35060 [Streptomyces inusitatus]|uniref:DUF3626 domain-containing protein n=1 Tax=Streptomyces inusitatus TaxID=68221 RepID=A0A918QBL4_9ACTN|nr:DUF3626 domain-containing protein [Streptomyces inusitatus]GGZ38009.1 hypothetical protein GCM10010387_35060 [Streptomyces inusitatus]